jgi:hypothetical protein
VWSKSVEPETCQFREGLVYFRKFFQQRIFKFPAAVEVDFTHSMIVMPERTDDIGHIFFGPHCPGKYDNWQFWPDFQVG